MNVLVWRDDRKRSGYIANAVETKDVSPYSARRIIKLS